MNRPNLIFLYLIACTFVPCTDVLANADIPKFAIQRLKANLGEGCRFAVTLPGKKGVRVPSNSDQTAVGGNPEMRQGGMVAAPYPSPWKSSLPSIGFNLYCYDKSDPKQLHTYGVLNEKNQRWNKDVFLMRKSLKDSEDSFEKVYAEQIIATTYVYDIRARNAHGWADTFEELTGDERGRKRYMSFCIFHQTKALCGNGTVAQLAEGRKGDLTPYALEILKSIEFLPDGPSETAKQ